jgi:hypothetical protein
MDRFLFDERQDHAGPGVGVPDVILSRVREFLVLAFEIDARHAQLTEIVGALGPTRRFTSGLYSRQQQPHQDANDCNHNEKLYERKCRAVPSIHDY